jgi:hypothetical protein
LLVYPDPDLVGYTIIARRSFMAEGKFDAIEAIGIDIIQVEIEDVICSRHTKKLIAIPFKAVGIDAMGFFLIARAGGMVARGGV